MQIRSITRHCHPKSVLKSCSISSGAIEMITVKLQKDLREFIELMNSQDVEYVLVGGHAVAYHGYPRFTVDLDFW